MYPRAYSLGHRLKKIVFTFHFKTELVLRFNSALQREMDGLPTPLSDFYTVGHIPDTFLREVILTDDWVPRSWESRLINDSNQVARHVGNIAFVLFASNISCLELQRFEEMNCLRNDYSIIFAVQVPLSNKETLSQITLPKDYHLLSLGVGNDISSVFSHRQMLVNFKRAHLALMSTFFDDGHICVDPMDFVYFCNGLDRIIYQFLHAPNLEIATTQLAQMALNLPGAVKNIFICSDLTGLGSIESLLNLACIPELSNELENVLLSSPTNIQDSTDVELHIFFGI